MRGQAPFKVWKWRAVALLASLGALAATGCFPSVRITRAECRRLAQGEQFDGLAFVVTVDTTNVVDQQILYSVTIEDAEGNPLRSRDGRYEDSQGRVAASKALMVLQAPWRFDDQTIAIPADELPLSDARGPLTAVFTIATPEGDVLAQQRANVPVQTGGRAIAARPTTPDASNGGRPPLAPPRLGASRMPPARPSASSQAEPTPPASAAPRPASATPRPIVATRPPPVAAEPGSAAPHSRAAEPPARDRPTARNERSAVPPQSTTAPGTSPRTAAGAAGDRRGALPPRAGEPATQGDTRATRPSAEAPPRAAESDGRAVPPAPGAPAGGRPAATQPAPSVRLYTVQKGDSLAGIAKRELGSPLRWREIFDLNRDKLPTPDSLREGMELRMPAERATRP